MDTLFRVGFLWSVVALGVAVWPCDSRGAVDDPLVGSRSYAMGGATRALGNSNDVLSMNPAGIAAVEGYGSIDFQYGFTNIDNLGRFGLSVVDAKSGPVAGGFALTYERGRGNKLTKLVVGAAYPVVPTIILGASLRHIRGTYQGLFVPAESVRVYTGDVGVCVSLGNGLRVGAAYNSIVKTDAPQLTPATVGLGASVDVHGFAVAADTTFASQDGRDQSYHVGVEYIAAATMPLRLGWTRQRIARANGTNPYENAISAGLAWMSQTGSLEGSCRRSLDRGANWGCLGALKLGF